MMQQLRTSVAKDTLNPEWNEELTLYVKDVNIPILLVSTETIYIMHISSDVAG